MKPLLRLAGIALMLTLAACTTDVNPVDVTPTAIASPNVGLSKAVQQPDGTWNVEVDVPANRCGVPAGIFIVNIAGNGLASWHESNGTYDVTCVVSIQVKNKNWEWPVPEKIVKKWTVKVLPDGPTVSWTETWTRLPNGATTISGIKCS